MGLLATVVIFGIFGVVAITMTRIITDAIAKDGSGKRAAEQEVRDARRS